ncbi:MAG: (2E,6E)-farnesyl diphosphate synthase [Gammaproteobacteria bacterium]|nr:MAG: (2E,6E)-farnesyl diphosphate synthase [Gammaproteobacteria bacterium]
MSAEALLNEYQARVERALNACLPPAGSAPAELHRAMRYAVLDGGKRIRPALVYAAGCVTGAEPALLDAPACAVEMIHAYSLVHDDLPAMDDDDLRRGKPTCHKAFGEATAILAGDALIALAFQLLARAAPPVTDSMRVKMIETLAQASGSHGMAGGQALDLAAAGKTLSLAELELMHVQKTGALIRASVLLGAYCGPNLDQAVLSQLDRYAKRIGLAFQIQDDILDETGDTQTLGKTQGADRARNKPTYPALLGLSQARQIANDLRDAALDSLAGLDGRAEALRQLAHYIVARTS